MHKYEYGHPTAPNLYRLAGVYMPGLAQLFVGEKCTLDGAAHTWEHVSPGTERCRVCGIHRTDTGYKNA